MDAWQQQLERANATNRLHQLPSSSELRSARSTQTAALNHDVVDDFVFGNDGDRTRETNRRERAARDSKVVVDDFILNLTGNPEGGRDRAFSDRTKRLLERVGAREKRSDSKDGSEKRLPASRPRAGSKTKQNK